MKTGGKILITTNALIKLKSANKITIKPETLKKIPDFEFLPRDRELNDTNPKIGSVPNANDNIISAPCIKFPVERV